MKDDILKKVKKLIESIHLPEKGKFQEKDAIYLLVETYKIKERELENQGGIRSAFPHLNFFRDWALHTNLHNAEWIREKDRLNNKEALLGEIISIIEDEETKQRIISLWPSFEEALNLITKDQKIEERVRSE